MMKPAADTRALSGREWLLNVAQRFGGLIAVQVLHIAGPLDAELVRRGLAFLQASHPILRVRVRPERFGFRTKFPLLIHPPEFVTEGTGPMPLRLSQADWREEMKREQSTAFPADQPRMRAVLAGPDSEGITHLLLTADHAIGDAQAASMAGRQLMEFLA